MSGRECERAGVWVRGSSVKCYRYFNKYMFTKIKRFPDFV